MNAFPSAAGVSEPVPDNSRQKVRSRPEPLKVYGLSFRSAELDKFAFEILNAPRHYNRYDRQMPAILMLQHKLPKSRMSARQNWRPWRWVEGPPDEEGGRLMVLVVATNETEDDLDVARNDDYLRMVYAAMGRWPSWYNEI